MSEELALLQEDNEQLRDLVDRGVGIINKWKDRSNKLEADNERLRKALNGMMVFYGMDEDRDNGACAVTWDKARAALEDESPPSST